MEKIMKTSLRKFFYPVLIFLVVVLVLTVFIDAPASYELSETEVANPLVKK